MYDQASCLFMREEKMSQMEKMATYRKRIQVPVNVYEPFTGYQFNQFDSLILVSALVL